MSASGYTHSVERELNDRTPESFFEAETVLESQNYDFNLVGNDTREVDGEEREVFIYELYDELQSGFYLFESDGEIYSKLLEPGEDEPSI